MKKNYARQKDLHAEFTQQESTQLKENISLEENVAYGDVGNMSRL